MPIKQPRFQKSLKKIRFFGPTYPDLSLISLAVKIEERKESLMSSLATARYDSTDDISQARKPEVTGTFSVTSEPVAIPCPEFAGYKVRQRGTTPVYVIDRDGYRRLVPFPSTFINLFTDSALTKDLVVSDMVEDIAEGQALDEGAILIRGISSESIYLLNRGTKRFIAGHDVMKKYGFNEDCVVLLQQIVVNAIPTGDDWE